MDVDQNKPTRLYTTIKIPISPTGMCTKGEQAHLPLEHFLNMSKYGSNTNQVFTSAKGFPTYEPTFLGVQY